MRERERKKASNDEVAFVRISIANEYIYKRIERCKKSRENDERVGVEASRNNDRKKRYAPQAKKNERRTQKEERERR